MDRRQFFRSSAHAGLAAGITAVVNAETPAALPAGVNGAADYDPAQIAECEFFCGDAEHTHDSMAAELMQYYGCHDLGELKDKLTLALTWAEDHLLEFQNHSTGFYDSEPIEGVEVIMGRFTVAMTLPPYDESAPEITLVCETHQNLTEAAVALVVYEHPLLRRLVENGPKDIAGREQWQRIAYGQPDGGHYSCFAERLAYLKATDQA